MRETYTILVCESHRPRIHGGGCCSDKGGASLRTLLEEKLQHRGLSSRVKVRPVNCLRNCRAGISLKILEDQTLYGHVKPGDLDDIIDQHIIAGKPLERLFVSEQPRFYSF